MLDYRVTRRTYSSGYWQSERYFKDIEGVLRRDLTITLPPSAESKEVAERIQNSESVGIHVRSYKEISRENAGIFLGRGYYHRAVGSIAERVTDPHFFCFSDDPAWVKENLRISYPMVIVDCNNGKGYDGAVEDLWLMSRCSHHIIANSTFGWWGAWLNPSEGKIVVMPPDQYLISPGLKVAGWMQG